MNDKQDTWRQCPTLHGEHVALRPLAQNDASSILRASSDGELWRVIYTGAPGPDTIGLWMATALAQANDGYSLPLVATRPDGEVIGSSRFRRMNRPHRRLEIGTTFFARSVQRTGVNTETKLLMLSHAFERLDCECVQLRTDRFNRASRTAIERLGAKMDGVLRNHWIMADGRVRDTAVYSILRSEWPGVKQNIQFLLARGAGDVEAHKAP
jgi:N-acetyltransferase